MKKHNSKLLALSLALLMAVLTLFSGCISSQPSNNNGGNASNSHTEPANSTTKELIEYINAGKYQNAIDLYNSDIAGDYSLETEVADEIESIIKQTDIALDNGDIDGEAAKKVITVIDKVLAGTSIYVEDYAEYKSNINELIASKAAYYSGQELEDLGNYSAAIDEYKKVIGRDSFFADAESAIDRCISSLKQEAFDAAKKLADRKQYADALKTLNDLAVLIPTDSEVLAKITVYEKTYITNAINQAKAAFVNTTDYEDALKIINTALQQIPNDSELLREKEYYSLFQPVNLYDLKPFNGELVAKEKEEDTRGNEHFKCFLFITNPTAKYELNSKYNVLTMTIYGRDKSVGDKTCGTLEIYGDDVLLYSNNKIQLNGKAFEVEIDITGVSELKIFGDGKWYYRGFGLADVILVRTEK